MQSRIKKIIIILFVSLFINLGCFIFTGLSNAVIYKIINSDGSIHFTDDPYNGAASGAVRKAVYKSSSYTPKYTSKVLSNAYSSVIDEVAQKYNHDPKLIKSIIKHESNFDPEAVSNKGAVGLMQLMPDTASRFGVTDTFDPKQNIEGGAAYLDYLMKHFEGDLPLVIAAYNAGEGAVQKYSGIPPYNETQEFVGRVLGTYTGSGDISASGSKTKSTTRASRTRLVKKNDGSIMITNR
ncbi:MAG: lytic transglycosylase domain-containing protein [Candidatus Schekmanbacteria bacterium]|nr:lytic transglycosylase domain-containing protein [Candidatus Schekmanbacteria bacterium]